MITAEHGRSRGREASAQGRRGARATPARAAVLLLALAGCGTARITRLDTRPGIEAYDAHAVDDVLAIGVQIEDRPGDKRFWLNARFRDRGLLVLSAKLRNTGRERLLLQRRDLVVTTRNGRKLVPLTPVEAVDRAKGVLGVYRPLSLGTIHYGYDTYALPDLVILGPGEEAAGYLYFAAGEDQWDEAKQGRLRVRFVRYDIVGESEYGVSLSN
jgi:hypothetical protein